jgi:hypothetical protein
MLQQPLQVSHTHSPGQLQLGIGAEGVLGITPCRAGAHTSLKQASVSCQNCAVNRSN